MAEKKATPTPKPQAKPTPKPRTAPKSQPNVVPQSSRPTLTPPSRTTPTPKKTPTKTPTKVEFTGPDKYKAPDAIKPATIDPKVQARIDAAKAKSDAAKAKIDEAKAKSDAAKKSIADAKKKADAAAKKKAEDDAKKKIVDDDDEDDTGTGNDFVGKFITTKSVKVDGGTNIFNVFSNGKGGTYEEFVAFIPDDAGGDDTESNLRAAELLTEEKRDRQRTALEEFVSILSGAGLKDLADEVNKMILDDKTAAQIKLEIRKTKSYEARFPGMKALSDACSSA